MRVLLAGATGAVGKPLTRQLLDAGHDVLGITRSQASAQRLREAGAEAVVVDAMDRDGLLRALEGQRADAVIHQLTALRKPPIRHRDMAATNALRITGTAHLLAAAHELGARRFVTQSIVFGYGYGDHGARPLTEDDPFGIPVRGPIGAHLAATASTERQVFETPGIEGVSLRYGLFYGPGAGTAEMVELLRRRRIPVPSGPVGTQAWVHVEDAAGAAVLALEKGRAGQAYNIVDDEPARLRDFLTELAAAYGVPKPRTVPSWLLLALPYAHAFMTTSMRVSNAKARHELGWAPRYPSYREGIRQLAR